MENLLPRKKYVKHGHKKQGLFGLQFHYRFTTAAALSLFQALDRDLICSPLQLIPEQEWELISSGLHQLKLLWSSIFRDHGDPKNVLLNSSPHELASDSSCVVEDHKSAETSKFLQTLLISTKWYLLMRPWISRRVPAAPLSGKRNGQKKGK